MDRRQSMSSSSSFSSPSSSVPSSDTQCVPTFTRPPFTPKPQLPIPKKCTLPQVTLPQVTLPQIDNICHESILPQPQPKPQLPLPKRQPQQQPLPKRQPQPPQQPPAPRLSLPELMDRIWSRMSVHQRTIIDECMQKGSMGLLVPMGTGKTIISILIALKQLFTDEGNASEGRILVVVTKMLLTTWREEMDKFLGKDLSYEILHGESVKLLSLWRPSARIIVTTKEFLAAAYKRHSVGNYFTYLHRDEGEFAPEIRYYNVPDRPYLTQPSGDGYLYSVKWCTLIVDEAHGYLNPSTHCCRALASLSTYHRVLLSGTMFAEPRAERLFGYYLILNWPHFPRNYPDFSKMVTSKTYNGVQETLVKRITNPDFSPPPINKQVISHPLTETEALIYTSMKKLLMILKKRHQAARAQYNVVDMRLFSSYIVAMISYLRQCLVSPLIPITSVALNVASVEARNELGEMFMTHINELHITDWLNEVDSLYSSRLRTVRKLVDDHATESIVIFSCFRVVINALMLYLPKDRVITTITGTDSAETRYNKLQTHRQTSNGILAITYDIGGNGLNLPQSSTVILVDFWWNEAKSSQGIARILRPGQTAAQVNIYYLTSNTGMENAIFKLQGAKVKVGKEIMTGRMKSKIDKIKINDILQLIEEEDNITILNALI